MTSRHLSQLMGVLDEVANRGWGLLEWWKLRLWYGVKKLKKEPYRDIAEKWAELTNGAELRVVSTSEGILLLGQKTSSFEEWTK